MSSNSENIKLVAPGPDDPAPGAANDAVLKRYPLAPSGEYMLPARMVWALLPEQRRRAMLKVAGAHDAYISAWVEWRFEQFNVNSQRRLYEALVSTELYLMDYFQEA